MCHFIDFLWLNLLCQYPDGHDSLKNLYELTLRCSNDKKN